MTESTCAAPLSGPAPPDEDTAAEAALFARLDRLGIACQTHRHPPLHTVDESRSLRGTIPGLHAKNLLIRDKAGRHALIVAEEAAAIDLKALAGLLGLGRPSFASAERLMALLRVRPGAVTPFALMHAPAGALAVALDRRLIVADKVNFHPLHNRATITISGHDLSRFLDACGHRPRVLDF